MPPGWLDLRQHVFMAQHLPGESYGHLSSSNPGNGDIFARLGDQLILTAAS
jgi:hypothetical protein